MRPVYLLIEEVNRELLSRLLIGQRLAVLGHPVMIGQQWWFAANFGALRPGAVLLKGNNRIQARYMKAARAAGHRVASIDEESFVSSSAEEIAAQYDPSVAEHCDRIFVQGTFQRAVVANRLPSAGDRIRLTGNPRADQLRDPAFRPRDPIVDRYRAEQGPYILVNTNFTTINPKIGDVYTYFQTCSRIGVLDDAPVRPVDRFFAWCNWERENLRAMVRVVDRLRRIVPHRRVVLRPHPSERAQVWRDRYAAADGVTVIAGGDHLAWIDGASLLLHSGCSTGLEAHLLSRPAVSLTPGDRWWKTPAISNIVNPVSTTVEEALAMVLDGLALSGNEAASRTMAAAQDSAALREYLSDTPGTSAAERIARELSRLCESVDEPRERVMPSVTASPVSRRIVEKAFVTLDAFRRRLSAVERASSAPARLDVREIAPAVFRLDASGDAREPLA